MVIFHSYVSLPEGKTHEKTGQCYQIMEKCWSSPSNFGEELGLQLEKTMNTWNFYRQIWWWKMGV